MVSDRRGLGERLKRHRERHGVTLAQISQTTKVPASLFAGLEKGDCSRWPAGLYARAYVRAYAEAIGMNADEVVEEFSVAFGAPLKSDGIEAPASLSSRAPGALRLSLVPETLIDVSNFGRRAALAAADLIIGFLIVAIAYVGLDQGVWVTATLVLTYFTLGRLISDEPLLYRLFRRVRVPSPARAAAEQTSGEVAGVADPASTVA